MTPVKFYLVVSYVFNLSVLESRAFEVVEAEYFVQSALGEIVANCGCDLLCCVILLLSTDQ